MNAIDGKMSSKWAVQRIPGGIMCSHRQIYDTRTGLLTEEIILEEIPQVDVNNPLRRRK